MSTATPPSDSVEALRQAQLLAAIWQHPASAGSAPYPAGLLAPPNARRPLGPYTSHAQAAAVQVLSSAYPTINAMIGSEALGVLAWRLWLMHPPQSGDLNRWGQPLPSVIEASPELAPWPYLADAAHLDWACHHVLSCGDADTDTHSLQRLGDTAPEQLILRLKPDVTLVASQWPIHTLQEAHRHHLTETMLDQCLGQPSETVVVWREGWHARSLALPEALTDWMAALCDAASTRDLDTLLTAQADDFDFTAWLSLALQMGWFWRVDVKSPLA